MWGHTNHAMQLCTRQAWNVQLRAGKHDHQLHASRHACDIILTGHDACLPAPLLHEAQCILWIIERSAQQVSSTLQEL